MKEIPKGGFLGKIYHTVKWATGFQVGLYAAHASFFIVLSLFPTLVLLLGLLRYTGLQAESLLSVLQAFFPEALFPAVSNVVRKIYLSTTGTVLSISAIGALWSASRGIYGLVTGLNGIYGVQESRGYIYTRLVSVGYMFAFLAILLLTLVLNVYGTTLLQSLSVRYGFLGFWERTAVLRFLLPVVLQISLFTAMYMVFPNEKVGFFSALPGAALSAVGWLLFSEIYSVYVTHFSTYAGIYDSLYAVAIGMLWLYFCISIVFYGGVLNRYLKKR